MIRRFSHFRLVIIRWERVSPNTWPATGPGLTPRECSRVELTASHRRAVLAGWGAGSERLVRRGRTEGPIKLSSSSSSVPVPGVTWWSWNCIRIKTWLPHHLPSRNISKLRLHFVCFELYFEFTSNPISQRPSEVYNCHVQFKSLKSKSTNQLFLCQASLTWS